MHAHEFLTRDFWRVRGREKVTQRIKNRQYVELIGQRLGARKTNKTVITKQSNIYLHLCIKAFTMITQNQLGRSVEMAVYTGFAALNT